MSQFELIDTLSTQINLAITFLMAYLSATSAYLAVSYVAGSDLPKFLARAMLVIYALAAYFLTVSFQRVLSFALAIREQMHEIVQWHPVVHEPQWLLPLSMWVVIVVMVLLFSASVWYASRLRIGARDAPPNKSLESDA